MLKADALLSKLSGERKQREEALNVQKSEGGGEGEEALKSQTTLKERKAKEAKDNALVSLFWKQTVEVQAKWHAPTQEDALVPVQNKHCRQLMQAWSTIRQCCTQVGAAAGCGRAHGVCGRARLHT